MIPAPTDPIHSTYKPPQQLKNVPKTQAENKIPAMGTIRQEHSWGHSRLRKKILRNLRCKDLETYGASSKDSNIYLPKTTFKATEQY